MNFQKVTRALSLGLVVVVTVEGCSARNLRPPATPRRVVPVVTSEYAPPREGEGLVTLDVVGRPARAELITERTQVLGAPVGYQYRGRGSPPTSLGPSVTTRTLCLTPCTVALPLGAHEVLFTSLDLDSNRFSTGFISVGTRPTVVRHALGRQESHLGSLVGALVAGSLGIAALLTGGMLLLFDGIDSTEPRPEDLGPAGGVTLGVGAALTGIAVVLGFMSRTELQPGATTQWEP